ncbi:WD repeat and HMG-box DNA binding-domain containing protein 1 [Halocaridina rubra]|uniref:WD repeat and HMG-box DNA binding-domain containing protein 1 n=1 Tax=Halocaridina rubra TaxID=373956 RepID=A0AAN8WM94_HALRR
MPPEEDILALCLGAGWVAVATDRRNLRIFSTSGVQRDLLNIPGPIVCLAGFENQLMFIFHSGMGVSGDQQMSAVVLNLDGGRHLIPTSCPLPLSPKSFLAWAGFSDEGTPVIMDSAGIIRILHYKYGVNWTSALNTKNHTRGKSDHYFLVGLSEMQSNVRCILCKGSRYPPVLPKPHVSMIDLQMPLCELDTEKGGLEEKALRTGRLLTSLERLTHLGYDVDQSKSEADIALKEALIKLFALACRTERESRAIEVCKLMPSYQTVQLAIKYAGKLHRLQLADRLGDVASAKMEEEIEKESRNHTYLDRENMPSYSASVKKYQYGTSDDELEDDMNQEQEQENESADPETHDNPLLAAAIRRENSSTKSSLLLSPSTKNPFKKNTPSSGHQSGKRGIDVIDKFRKAQRKPENSPVLRPFVKKLQSKQTTMKKKLTSEDVNGQDVTDKENKSANTIDTSTPSTMNPFKKHESQNSALEIKQVEKEAPVKRPSALQLWLDDNEEKVKTQFPEATDKDLILKAALIFKDVDGEVKQKYKALAAGGVLSPNVNIQTPIPVPADEEKKRKIDSSNNQESPLEKKAKGSGVKKLSAFAFNKDTDV